MKNQILKVAILLPLIAGAKTIKVAVIDTGINHKAVPICDDGLVDLTGRGMQDEIGHGSHVSDVIDQNVKNDIRKDLFDTRVRTEKTDYCQIVLKAWYKDIDGKEALRLYNNALMVAIAKKVDVINYSGGGRHADLAERQLVYDAINSGIKVFAAAGNDGMKFGTKIPLESGGFSVYAFYPALHFFDVVVVGNLRESGVRASSSNYGPGVDVWEIGTNVIGLVGGHNTTMTGTSQATAVATGKYIRSKLK